MKDSAETRLRIGNTIKEARLRRGLTQRELGSLIGRSNNLITNWEKGTHTPDVEMIELLCSVLNITVKEMFPGLDKTDSIGGLTDAEQNLIELWRKLSQVDQLKIMGMIELKLHHGNELE